MAPGAQPFGPQGHSWQDLCRRPPNIATYLTDSSGPHGFKEDFWIFFSYIALYKHMTPWGVASLEPRGFISSIM